MPILENELDIDVKRIVRWLGKEGTRAGLQESKQCTVAVLSVIAKDLGIEISTKMNRKQLIDKIVLAANKRIDRPIEELLTMGRDQLIEYFEHVDAGREELFDLLKAIEIDPGREGRRNLLKFAAAELSETGRFQRIASKDGPKS